MKIIAKGRKRKIGHKYRITTSRFWIKTRGIYITHQKLLSYKRLISWQCGSNSLADKFGAIFCYTVYAGEKLLIDNIGNYVSADTTPGRSGNTTP
jgi:hypothetical protein